MWRWLKITQCALPTTRGIRNGSLPSNAWGGLSCLHFLEALGLEDKSNSRFPNEMWRLFVSPFLFRNNLFLLRFLKGWGGDHKLFCLFLRFHLNRIMFFLSFCAKSLFLFRPRDWNAQASLSLRYSPVWETVPDKLYIHTASYIWEKRLFFGGSWSSGFNLAASVPLLSVPFSSLLSLFSHPLPVSS